MPSAHSMGHRARVLADCHCGPTAPQAAENSYVSVGWVKQVLDCLRPLALEANEAGPRGVVAALTPH